MTTLTEFIAEIKSKLPTYADEIDEIGIKLDVIGCLRKFGNNIADLKEDIVKVHNSKAKLNEGFKSLRLAYKVEPFGCHVEGDLRNVTDSYIYKERVENPAYFDEVNQEYVRTCESKIITEKITINNTKLSFYYNPRWLSLTKHIDKKTISQDCINMHPSIRNSYPNEISIKGSTLNANFPEGRVYLQYYSLPTNEEGELVIPELSTGDIYRYIETYVKYRIAENLIANNLNPQGIGQLYSSWGQQLVPMKRAALVESKFKGLGNYQKNLQKQNREEFSRFRLPKTTQVR